MEAYDRAGQPTKRADTCWLSIAIGRAVLDNSF